MDNAWPQIFRYAIRSKKGHTTGALIDIEAHANVRMITLSNRRDLRLQSKPYRYSLNVCMQKSWLEMSIRPTKGK